MSKIDKALANLTRRRLILNLIKLEINNGISQKMPMKSRGSLLL
jgi:hypothetical protein